MSASFAWDHELQSWLEPFLTPLRNPARRRMCPLYVADLIGPGERKRLQPVAAWVARACYDQLHHFVAVGPWDEAPLDAELLAQANRLVGRPDAILVIADTALLKKGTHSVGVATQYAGVVGKNANVRPGSLSRSPRMRCRSQSACGCICLTLRSKIPSACSTRGCLRGYGRSAPFRRSRWQNSSA